MSLPLDKFIQQLEDSGIVAGETLREFIPPSASPKDAEELARELVRQKKLTKFQVEEVSKGKAKSLILGNYILMEKIGVGGMGQVFKAGTDEWIGSSPSNCFHLQQRKTKRPLLGLSGKSKPQPRSPTPILLRPTMPIKPMMFTSLSWSWWTGVTCRF